ncbi:MAG: type 4a pilus biogenesis protein PilO [Proteobacteria bacterium]|nr:type 4a pilus biogenesis protein PilO [Pseudomonadota bacterium]MBU4295772.1 type 4a pilus biogenesis protein PilO [Pseudomonadota bacterium]MCG2747797.1 type 4a pilus biogenesis protein PilO [Desulfobulbaceae bacterium]
MNINKVKIQEAINSFLDEKVSHLKPQHKAMICIGAILLPCVAFYFLSYSPKTIEINMLQSQQKNLEDEITKVEKASREITKYRAEMAETKLMFAKASALLPQQQEIPSLLTSISDIGQNSGLDFLSFIPKNEMRKEFYADIPVDIKVRGTYHNVGVFLDKISNLSRIVTVSNINMGGSKLQSGEMILETTFSLVTYRFVEPAPLVQGKNKN